MKKLNVLLVFLISSLAITGISFIDGKIWDVIFVVIGMLAYAIVGVLFSIGILNRKQDGKDAYALVFFLLILGGYAICKSLEKLRLWILSWPLNVKIIIIVVIAVAIVGLIVYAVLKKKKEKVEDS